MKHAVMLTLQGKQYYLEQDPEVIELTTEGTMEATENGWRISYEESELTGLKGVTTTFDISPGQVILDRQGALRSQMQFRQGAYHHSLYEMEFGAMQITVYAAKVQYDISQDGGTLDLHYAIDIENTASGMIEYHLEINTK